MQRLIGLVLMVLAVMMIPGSAFAALTLDTTDILVDIGAIGASIMVVGAALFSLRKARGIVKT